MEESLAQSLGRLSHEPSLLMTVLFGSHARGFARQSSDIDVAILADQPIDVLEWTNKLMEVTRANNIDIVDLRSVNPLLAAHIACYGQLIYEREPSLFHEFQCLAFRKFMDMKKFWKAQEEATKKFLKSRGMA